MRHSLRGTAAATVAFGVVAAGSPAHGGAVVVDQVGFGQVTTAVGSPYSFGVVLANRSTTRDAVDVTVSVNVLGPNRIGTIYGHEFSIAVIPAGRRFVLGDGSTNLGGRITAVRAVVRVRAMQPHRRSLPPVSSIRIDRKSSSVRAELQNPYSTAIDLFAASGYAVVFDRRGRVVGGGSITPLAAAAGGPPKLAPGGYLPISIPISGTSMTRAARAEVSINP